MAAWGALGIVLLVVQIGVGAFVSASYAGLSCPQLGACDNMAQLVHRAGAVLVVLVLLRLGVAAWRSGRRAGALLAILALVEVGLGVVLVLGGLPFAAEMLHNLTAALLLAGLLCLIADMPRLR
jgi:cytochrome c oxidase assembly protein subunit 15